MVVLLGPALKEMQPTVFGLETMSTTLLLGSWLPKAIFIPAPPGVLSEVQLYGLTQSVAL